MLSSNPFITSALLVRAGDLKSFRARLPTFRIPA